MNGSRMALKSLGLMLIALNVNADDRCARWTCEQVKAEIREIEARMRAGYSHAQGLRYEERLRELRDCRYRLCR